MSGERDALARRVSELEEELEARRYSEPDCSCFVRRPSGNGCGMVFTAQCPVHGEMRERAERVLRVEENPATSSGLRPWAQDALTLLDQIAQRDEQVRRLEEEIRLREQSQIPMIPRGAQRKMDALARRVSELEARLGRAAYVARNLHSMIDRETWRATGGDDGQGHYEGDYHAEQLLAEMEDWAALAAAPSEPAEEPRGTKPGQFPGPGMVGVEQSLAARAPAEAENTKEETA